MLGEDTGSPSLVFGGDNLALNRAPIASADFSYKEISELVAPCSRRMSLCKRSRCDVRQHTTQTQGGEHEEKIQRRDPGFQQLDDLHA